MSFLLMIWALFAMAQVVMAVNTTRVMSKGRGMMMGKKVRVRD